MTMSAARAAIERMGADPDLAERLTNATRPESALAMLHAEGFDVTQQEMRDATLDRFGDTLTADQLDAVAGGEYLEDVGTLGGFAVVVTTSAANAAV